MTIFGVALLALCTLIGVYLGDLLGVALGVKANVGGVGLAMILLIAARVWMVRHGKLSHGVTLGVEFWSTMYIPIVVAMAAQQNVVAAARGGPIVIIAATGSLLICFACVALLGRIGRRDAEPNPVVEHGGAVIAGDVYDEPPVWNPAIQKPDAPNATAPAAASSLSKTKV
jgi:malonate transporter MadL subunit